jgi:hypothetical protein
VAATYCLALVAPDLLINLDYATPSAVDRREVVGAAWSREKHRCGGNSSYDTAFPPILFQTVR